MGYVRFLGLVSGSGIVITDSGGIQEETTYLGIPCLTLRPNTERPITVTHGTNRLVAVAELRESAIAALRRGRIENVAIPLWDGHAAQRVAQDLARRMGVAETTRARA
jgi:UDP-N-acetylglucosamine 2-epimerase (non-hydrolysing)